MHELPWLATSWGLECIAKLEALDDVRKVLTHMCQFGMKSRTEGQGSELGPVLKPTGFLTNSAHIARELIRRAPVTTSTPTLSVAALPRQPYIPMDYARRFAVGLRPRRERTAHAG